MVKKKPNIGRNTLKARNSRRSYANKTSCNRERRNTANRLRIAEAREKETPEIKWQERMRHLIVVKFALKKSVRELQHQEHMNHLNVVESDFLEIE